MHHSRRVCASRSFRDREHTGVLGHVYTSPASLAAGVVLTRQPRARVCTQLAERRSTGHRVTSAPVDTRVRQRSLNTSPVAISATLSAAPARHADVSATLLPGHATKAPATIRSGHVTGAGRLFVIMPTDDELTAICRNTPARTSPATAAENDTFHHCDESPTRRPSFAENDRPSRPDSGAASRSSRLSLRSTRIRRLRP